MSNLCISTNYLDLTHCLNQQLYTQPHITYDIIKTIGRFCEFLKNIPIFAWSCIIQLWMKGCNLYRNVISYIHIITEISYYLPHMVNEHFCSLLCKSKHIQTHSQTESYVFCTCFVPTLTFSLLLLFSSDS